MTNDALSLHLHRATGNCLGERAMLSCLGKDSAQANIPTPPKEGGVGLCLAKTWYTLRMYDLEQSSIRIVPLRFLP